MVCSQLLLYFYLPLDKKMRTTCMLSQHAIHIHVNQATGRWESAISAFSRHFSTFVFISWSLSSKISRIMKARVSIYKLNCFPYISVAKNRSKNWPRVTNNLKMRVKILVVSLVAISTLKNHQWSPNKQKCHLDELPCYCCFYTAQLAVDWIGSVKRACKKVVTM